MCLSQHGRMLHLTAVPTAPRLILRPCRPNSFCAPAIVLAVMCDEAGATATVSTQGAATLAAQLQQPSLRRRLQQNVQQLGSLLDNLRSQLGGSADGWGSSTSPVSSALAFPARTCHVGAPPNASAACTGQHPARAPVAHKPALPLAWSAAPALPSSPSHPAAA